MPKLSGLLVETVWTVLTAALAAITTLEVVLFCKHNEALFRVVIIFVFYLSLAVIHFFLSATFNPKSRFLFNDHPYPDHRVH